MRTLSVVAVLVMVGTIVFGVTSGDFSGEAGEIVGLAWGKVTLIDLYVGLALFGGWIAFRERRLLPTAVWWAALVVLGNLATALYLMITAFGSDNATQLLLGDRVGADRPGP